LPLSWSRKIKRLRPKCARPCRFGALVQRARRSPKKWHHPKYSIIHRPP
jgi:hypothetical protein